VFRSARFSVVIKRILLSPEHQAIFPDQAGRINPRSKAVEWSTQAREQINDGQPSFSALGLLTGFTGDGAETLVMDDPYASIEKALSEITRASTWRFWTDTAAPRLRENNNVFIMFHRYHQDDQAGRALATGEFDLWRYAAQCDGVYIDEETGREFADPIGREEGAYLSARLTPAYYEMQRRNEQVWQSQFQGRPTAKTSAMFDVSRITTIKPTELPPLLHECWAWDNAATEGGGAYSAGGRAGIDAHGNLYIRNVKREQVNTAQREELQQQTARDDGKLVTILHPQDPGSAGKDVAFTFAQRLTGYTVISKPVSGSKEARAYDFSLACNSDRIFVVDDGTWDVKALLNELKYFPVGTYKDQVDCLADAVNHLQGGSGGVEQTWGWAAEWV
jgi:phage terminase large subunit-like protein